MMEQKEISASLQNLVERLRKEKRTKITEDIERIRNSLDSLPSMRSKALVLTEITDLFLDNELVIIAEVFGEEARQSAERVKAIDEKARTFAELASIYYDYGYKSKSEDLIEDSIDSAEEVEGEGRKVEVFISIAEKQLNVGSDEIADKAIDDILPTALNLAEEKQELKPLARLAEVKAHLDVGQTRKICSTVLEILKSSDLKDEKGTILSSLAVAFIRIDEVNRSFEMVNRLLGTEYCNFSLSRVIPVMASEGALEKAIELTDMIDNSMLRDSVKAEIASLSARRENIREAEELVKEIEEPFEKDIVFKELVCAFIGSANEEKAEEYLEKIENDEMKTLALMEMSLHYFRRDDLQISEKCFLRAHDLAKKLRSSSTLLQVVEGFLEMDRRKEALSLTEKIRSPEEKAIAYGAIAASG